MIGDTPYDVEAARRAHVRVIAFECGGWGRATCAARPRSTETLPICSIATKNPSSPAR